MMRVADPFGRSMRTFHDQKINSTAGEEERRSWMGKIDAQEKYMLVRLPEWLGGSENELSAYRVFSAFDVAGQCNVFYQDRVEEIWDPCSGNMYRPWDGLVLSGAASYGASGAGGGLFSSSILALPQLRLDVDSEGYIVAYRLDNTLGGDGVVGEGRRLAPQELEQSNERMIRAASAYAGSDLLFPASISDKYLIQIALAGEAIYSNNFADFGHDFAGHERIFSAAYEPRPLTTSPTRFVITGLNETGESSKATFDSLFGAESLECDQGCRFVIRQGDSVIARVDTGADDGTINAEALVWGDGGIMVAIEGINSGMEELLSVAASLDQDL
jgi:hypothetical protein